MGVENHGEMSMPLKEKHTRQLCVIVLKMFPTFGSCSEPCGIGFWESLCVNTIGNRYSNYVGVETFCDILEQCASHMLIECRDLIGVRQK